MPPCALRRSAGRRHAKSRMAPALPHPQQKLWLCLRYGALIWLKTSHFRLPNTISTDCYACRRVSDRASPSFALPRRNPFPAGTGVRALGRGSDRCQSTRCGLNRPKIQRILGVTGLPWRRRNGAAGAGGAVNCQEPSRLMQYSAVVERHIGAWVIIPRTFLNRKGSKYVFCLLYTSDAADEN